MNTTYTILFRVEGQGDRTVTVSGDESLLDVAKRADVPLDAPCSGNGTCGKCRVKVLSGEAESEPGRHISREEYAQGYRLACASRSRSDMAVLVPPSGLAYQSRIKISEGEREQAVFSALREEL
ncbi:MAG: 2Fe-2S iron-sulfur cluster binding domain-containing protein, partial [Treponema sp.]|nr:2Fe-2S iron-sulfur cluster binding domain-containing protein [Treponema sp.]